MRKLLLGPAVFFCSLAAAAWDPQSAAYTRLLAAHVHQGVVDYAGIRKDSARLDDYLKAIGEVAADAFSKMSRADQMAYLINAYNAFTLRLIADFYPIDSIRDIGSRVGGGGLFGRSSRQWKISEYEVAGHKVTFRAMGRPVTLDEIEHENLRPKYQDARVHFALVCGAVSCPLLRSEAYVGAMLDAQLDDQGRRFLADPFRNHYDAKSDTLSVSKIFDWYKEDFTRHGTLVDFLKAYLPPEAKKRLSATPTIKYIPYDWSLNDKAGRGGRY